MRLRISPDLQTEFPKFYRPCRHFRTCGGATQWGRSRCGRV